MPRRLVLCALTSAFVVSCGDTAKLQVSAGTGPDPQLPPPVETLLPTVRIASAKGWPEGAAPMAGHGLKVNAFAVKLHHPRWLHVLPNGDVLVAESDGPERPDDAEGIRGLIYRYFLRKGGSGTKSADRITLLRDADGDGIAEKSFEFLAGVKSPFGMALVGGDLYVASTEAILRFPYETGKTNISAPATTVVALPAGRRNHHWTKGLIASPDGSKLFASIGANSDHGENGMDEERCPGSTQFCRAAIWEIDLRTGTHRVFASGLRNPVGMAWEPETPALWAVVNERDELGSDLVPDYMTSVRDGGFYGWPYRYFGTHDDHRVKPWDAAMAAKSVKPDYALGPHTASLGLAWSEGQRLSPQFERGMFVGQHGSWNRNPPSGYRVVFVPFSGGKPSGLPVDVLTGFVNDRFEALGRPVGVAIDRQGALLVADDVGGTVWRVTAGGVRQR